jgi:nucleoside-diphosphate-sugar epimerase
MRPMHFLIAGCGYLGAALAQQLSQAFAHGGPGVRLWGLRRQVAELPECVLPVQADLNDPLLGRLLPQEPLDAVFLCTAADRSDAQGYRDAYVRATQNLVAALKARSDPALRRLFFTSSTAVYAQQDGEWVDETTPACSSHFRGATLLEAEALVHSAPCPATVLRLGGLYGPGRARLLQSVAQRTATFPETHSFTNRIHRDDAAGALVHLLRHPQPDSLYLGVDCEPAAQHTVLGYLHTLLQQPLSPEHEQALAKLARGAPKSGKRCRNTRLCSSGYRFAYPTFREGFAALHS